MLQLSKFRKYQNNLLFDSQYFSQHRFEIGGSSIIPMDLQVGKQEETKTIIGGYIDERAS